MSGFGKQPLQLTSLSNNHNFKQIGKLADKMAKATKELRQELNNKRSVDTIKPEATSYDLSHLHQQAETIDKLLEGIRVTNIASILDVSTLEETHKSLVEIEGKVLGIKLTARSKN